MSKLAACVACLMFVASVRSEASEVIFDVDFESPPYNLGAINGQDGWSSGGTATITDERAYSGEQSFITTNAAPFRLFDNGAVLNVDAWYMQAHAYVESSTASERHYFGAGSALGTAWYLEIDGAGEVVFNSGTNQHIFQLGASVLNNWLTLRIEEISPNQVVMSIVGANVNFSDVLFYGAPTNPTQIRLYSEGLLEGGHVFWDDILVEHGIVPAPGALVMLGFGLCAMRSRRRTG